MVFVFRLGAFQTQVSIFSGTKPRLVNIRGKGSIFKRHNFHRVAKPWGSYNPSFFISKSKLEQVVVRTAGFKRRGFNHDKL